MSACGTTCGITKERAKDLVRARALAEQVHPHLVWSKQIAAPAVPHDALRALATTLEALLPVRVFVRVGDADGGECDSLFVLAGLHHPSLAELVESGQGAPSSPATRETYLRVPVSPHGRFATIVEVVATSEITPEGIVVAFEPQAGVVDRRLQSIVKGLQGALRKARLVVLDLSALLQPIETIVASPDLADTFDDPVSLWSLLFETSSPLGSRASLVPFAGVADSRASAG